MDNTGEIKKILSQNFTNYQFTLDGWNEHIQMVTERIIDSLKDAGWQDLHKPFKAEIGLNEKQFAEYAKKHGWVELDKDQTTPIYESINSDGYDTYKKAQQDMLKTGFAKIAKPYRKG